MHQDYGGKKNFKCPTCGLEFHSIDNITRHLRFTHKWLPYDRQIKQDISESLKTPQERTSSKRIRDKPPSQERTPKRNKEECLAVERRSTSGIIPNGNLIRALQADSDNEIVLSEPEEKEDFNIFSLLEDISQLENQGPVPNLFNFSENKELRTPRLPSPLIESLVPSTFVLTPLKPVLGVPVNHVKLQQDPLSVDIINVLLPSDIEDVIREDEDVTQPPSGACEVSIAIDDVTLPELPSKEPNNSIHTEAVQIYKAIKVESSADQEPAEEKMMISLAINKANKVTARDILDAAFGKYPMLLARRDLYFEELWKESIIRSRWRDNKPADVMDAHLWGKKHNFR
ncbi:hypothetical protein CHS0354_007324 [Potamilus streckersoni]|uniref:C2H2-type domain-containing protein n=1 Tax=Potamilus streckersoni TaxID=2493646 RepID=A0AAE0TE83_9BIVA|nr:hypothetical protein CHS0354_007324 [Potamilus streckersoni]